MRSILQRFAFLIVFAGTLIWLIGGARKGFYVVTEEIPKIEPITEIEYTERHDKFLPGIDFLLGGFILGGSFFLISFLFSKPLNSKTVTQP